MTLIFERKCNFLFLSTNVQATEGAFFVDILVLKPGKTTADANKYFNKVEPVIKKHGLSRIIPGLNVVNNMKGSLNADLVNIWFVTNPSTTFKAIFSDPDYLQHVELRNATFDMKSANMMMLQAF
jgi:uncharacterized protein (DUF1330 family)